MSAHICLPLLSVVQKHGTRRTTTCDGTQLTAQQLHDRVACLSWSLSNVLNVTPGNRIALVGLNSDAFFEALLAVLDAGAVACPVNWRWSAAELAAAIELTQPSYLLVDDSCMQLALAAHAKAAHKAPVLRMGLQGPGSAAPQQQAEAAARTDQQTINTSVASCRGTTCLQDLLAAAAAVTSTQAGITTARSAKACPYAQQQQQHPKLQLLQPSSSSSSSVPSGTALVCFTSGTTSAPKGVVLTHAALLHQCMAKLAVVQYSAADVYLHVAPLFHIGGLSSAFALLAAGGQHIFMPRYSPTAALQLIKQHHVTAMIAVPAIMQDIVVAAEAMKAPQQQQQLPSLCRVLIGAGGMNQQLQQAVAKLFPNARLSTAYGMTECSSSITFITLQEQQQRMAAAAARGADAAAAAGVCVGWPGPGIAIRLDNSQNTPSGQSEQPQLLVHCSSSSSSSSDRCRQKQKQASSFQIGEVCTKGPHILQGYYRASSATAAVLTDDGWLRTGDLGYLDAGGCLWLVGRSKDMVKTGGENVLAAEVERVILQHAGVAAAAVVGLDHPRFGEQVAAGLVLNPGFKWVTSDNRHPQQQQQQQQELSVGILQQHCRDCGLSPYKIPRVLVPLAALPLNSSGKVVKAVVREHVQQQQQQESVAGDVWLAHRSKL